MRTFSALLLLILSITVIAGCGSSGTNMTAQPSPNQPAPAPTTGGGSSQFAESMLANDATGTVAGQVTVSPSGAGAMNVSGAAPNTTYTVQFCPFAAMNGACNTLATLTSSGSGAVSATFTVPGHGGFAGVFQLLAGSTVAFVSGFNIPANGSTLQAVLVRASTVAAGFTTQTQVGIGVGFDPLASGSVSVGTSDTVHVQLQGAAASQSYSVEFCRNGGGSSCFGVGGITTDASGNGSADLSLSSSVGPGNDQSGVFLITGGKPPAIEFVSGFTVP